MSQGEAIEKLEEIKQYSRSLVGTDDNSPSECLCAIYSLANQALTILRKQPVCKTCGGSGIKNLGDCNECGRKDCALFEGKCVDCRVEKQTYDDTCPDCKGTGINPDCTPPEAGKFVRQFRKLLNDKTLGTGKYLQLMHSQGLKACALLDQFETAIKLKNEQEKMDMETIGRLLNEIKALKQKP